MSSLAPAISAYVPKLMNAVIAGASDDITTTGVPMQNDHSLAWGLTAVSAGVMVLGIVEWAVHPAPTPLSADDAISLVDKHNAENNSIQARGQRDDKLAIAFGAIGVAGIATGVVLYALGRGSDEHGVAMAPTRGGVSVTWARAF